MTRSWAQQERNTGKQERLASMLDWSMQALLPPQGREHGSIAVGMTWVQVAAAYSSHRIGSRPSFSSKRVAQSESAAYFVVALSLQE